MELRHLTYFVAVAEELHFRRAAERLHIAQPAVSEQVRKLEAELGVQLFERTQRSVSLTAAGAAFLEEARRVLEQAERARRAARRARAGVTDRLRLGYLADALPAALPLALRRFAAETPGIDVQLEGHAGQRLVADVESGQLDAAVVCLPAPAVGLRVTVLGQETAVAALADAHPCAGQDAIALNSGQRTPIMMLDRDVNPAFHDVVVADCRRTGAAPALVETGIRTVGDLLLSVASGGGMALLPSSSANQHALHGVRFKPLAPPAPACNIALVSRADNESATLAAFVRLLGHHAGLQPRLAAVA
jgi:DNA-binding transcriptional LysR family regulator